MPKTLQQLLDWKPTKRSTWKKKADDLWSYYIVHRDSSCRRCGLKHWQMHPHHVISRGEHKTRHMPENGVGLCPGCHRWAHGHPLAFGDWFRSEPARNESYAIVEAVAYRTERVNLDYEEICRNLESQLNQLNGG